MVMAWLFQLEITCLVSMSATLEVYHDTPNLFMSPSIFIRSSFTIAFGVCLIGKLTRELNSTQQDDS